MKFPHLTYSEFIPRIRGLSEKPYNWDGMMMSDVTDIPSYWDGMRCYPVGGDYELKPGRTYRLPMRRRIHAERVAAGASINVICLGRRVSKIKPTGLDTELIYSARGMAGRRFLRKRPELFWQ